MVDVGAGTGKFTRAIVEYRGGDGEGVAAVEPTGLRHNIERSLPGVAVIEGTAQSMPLPDASCAAVVVAQAFHWFPTVSALREFHRVLLPGAKLGLTWNIR